MIYQIKNYITKKLDFVVSDQNTANNSIGNLWVNTCIVGTEEDANRILKTNQQTVLSNDKIADRLTTLKVTKTQEGEIWEKVDLTLENDNDNVYYRVSSGITGTSTEYLGLSAAKQGWNAANNELLTHYGFDNWTIIDNFPDDKPFIGILSRLNSQ